MSFWRTLAKIGIPIGAAIAAPFTGGATLPLIGLGAGAGAAEGALGGGGLKGALLGAGLGGATGGLLGGAGGAAGSAAGGGAASAAGGSVGSSVGSSILKSIPGLLGSLGPSLSTAAAGSAAQRNTEAPNLARAYEANLGATKLGDQRAMLASLLGGAQDASISRPAGSTIPTFGITGGLRPSALQGKDSLISRLQTPINPLEMPTAGKLEKGLGYAGLAGNILRALPKFGGQSSSGTFDTPNAKLGVPSMPWTLPPLPPQGQQAALGEFNPSQLSPFDVRKLPGVMF